MTRVPKSAAELRRLAVLVEGGSIFTDRHIPPAIRQHQVGSTFLAWLLMEPEQQDELIEAGLGLLYEDMSAAGPRSSNGFPVFFSFQWLTKDEADRMFGFVRELRKFQAGEGQIEIPENDRGAVR